MKKLMLAIAVAAVGALAFAGLDFEGAKALPVVPTATVNSGATNDTAFALGGLKGRSEVFVVANGNTSRTALNVTLWATNTAEGGWIQFADKTFPTNAGVYRVAFPGQYMTRDARLTVESVGAQTTFSAFVLSY